MNNNSKVKRLQLVNLVCYLFVIIVVALMWIFGLKVNTSESNPDSFGGAIGEAAAGIVYIILKLFFGIISSFFCILPFVISLINVIGKNQALTRYYVTFIVFSIIQAVTVSLFGWIIVASKNMIGYLFIFAILLDIISIVINAILIKIKHSQNI